MYGSATLRNVSLRNTTKTAASSRMMATRERESSRPSAYAVASEVAVWVIWSSGGVSRVAHDIGSEVDDDAAACAGDRVVVHTVHMLAPTTDIGGLKASAESEKPMSA